MTLPLFERLAAAEAAAEAEAGREKAEARVHRVREVARLASQLVERGLGEIWVEGELRNVKRLSGHAYFTLSDPDEKASIAGVMFRADAARTKARLENGARVRLRGRCTIYEERGQFQLVARLALPAGEGDLHAELELLKRRLAAEGLFSTERKRPLPRLPRVVGVVTSTSGAALWDVVRVARARCAVRLLVADCRVQGVDAAPSLVAALRRIARVPGVDVVIVGRGGGASEDLWAFNDERVARAIAACPVPVVSAVGHAQDVTLADLVADVRAATPSNAAELAVPDGAALAREIAVERARLERAFARGIERGRAALARSDRALVEHGDPRARLARARHAIVTATAAAAGALDAAVARRRTALADARTRVVRHEPRERLRADRIALDGARAALEAEARRTLAEARGRLEALEAKAEAGGGPAVARGAAALGTLAARLDAMSPLRVLARGYAVALDARDGTALTDAAAVAAGDAIHVRLHRGTLRATVDSVEPAAGGAPSAGPAVDAAGRSPGGAGGGGLEGP